MLPLEYLIFLKVFSNVWYFDVSTHTDFFPLTICLVPPLSSFLRVAAPTAQEIVRRISNLILLDGRGFPKNW